MTLDCGCDLEDGKHCAKHQLLIDEQQQKLKHGFSNIKTRSVEVEEYSYQTVIDGSVVDVQLNTSVTPQEVIAKHKGKNVTVVELV